MMFLQMTDDFYAGTDDFVTILQTTDGCMPIVADDR
jgi:hypothetical protein